MSDRSVKYTVQANLLEKGRFLSPPLSATSSAEDGVDEFEFHTIGVPPAGVDTAPPNRTFISAAKKEFIVSNLDKVAFLAFVPSDPASAKVVTLAIALETLAAAPTFGPVPITTNGDPKVPLKPEEIAASTLRVIATAAGTSLLLPMPDGGLVFAGPVARLLPKMLGGNSFAFSFWNLSSTHIGINVVIGLHT